MGKPAGGCIGQTSVYWTDIRDYPDDNSMLCYTLVMCIGHLRCYCTTNDSSTLPVYSVGSNCY